MRCQRDRASRRLIATVLLLASVSLVAARQSPASRDIEASVAAVAEDVLRRTAIAGVSVAVGRGGKVVFAKGFGLADAESRRALDAGAVMDIGSIGKQVTAAAVLKLVDERRVELDQPLARYLPGWDDGGRDITVRQLLNHTSGLEDPAFSEARPEPRFLAPAASNDLLAYARTARFRFQPEETWYYSNTGYVLLGLLLERLHGRPYGRVIEDAIARPLALDTLTYCDKARDIPNRARDYIVRNGKREPIPPIDVSWFGGAGSLCASPGDLVRWEYALWNGRVVPAAVRDAMHAPSSVHVSRGVTTSIQYGFGRASGVHAGHRKIGHTGSGAGISAMLAHYPDDDLVLAVLVNTAGTGVPDARSIEARLAEALLELRPRQASANLPVTSEQAGAWTGTYVGSYGPLQVEFTACESNALCARPAGAPGPPRQLPHRGNGVFGGPLGPGSEFRFVPTGARAEWVVHTMYGLHDNVLRRQETGATPRR